MLSTTARPLLFNITPSTLSPRHPILLRRRTNHRRHSLSTVTMSSSSSSQSVEHIVLFNAKPGTESAQLSAMMNGLNGLRSLDMVLYLTAGPILRNRSPSLNFTHMLHSRYRTKEDLANYTAHDEHLSVVRNNVLPICDDLMAVDWLSENLEGAVAVNPGSVMRVKFVKLKDGLGDSAKGEVYGVIGGLKEKVEGIEQYSYGENISPERAKGFSLASIGVFPGVKELDAVEENVEIGKDKDKVRDYVDDVVVVDFVVPSDQSASV